MAIILDGTDSIGDLGDALAAKFTTPTTAWASYTSTPSGITIGNGTVAASYCQIGKLVAYRITFTMGSTSSITGRLSFTLPAAAATPSFDNQSCVAHAYDSSATIHYVLTGDYFTGTINLNGIGAGATYATAVQTSSTIPFAWAVGDVVWINGTYEAA